ncbi:MAG TPA: hypothetical protein VMH91_00945 [Candidatus Paceibacterota bacterium]|nr:hypothetical protein [Candidatus Paceibacterota bacterium]
MKKWFKKIFSKSTIGLMFQAGTTVQFQGLTTSSNNTNALGPSLSGFFSGNNTDLAGFFNAAFTMALSAGAILAVLRLGYAGWLYMGAADMWGSKQHAKEVITQSILGLLLLIGIWIVLDQINPCLLNLNILQSIQGGSGTGQCGNSAPATAPQTNIVGA